MIKKNLLFSIPTLHRYDSCIQIINYVASGDVTPEAYLIIDNGGGIEDYIKNNNLTIPENCKIYSPNLNLGVASSWNVALFCGFEYTIISSDDIFFKDDAIKILIEKADSFNGEPCFICPSTNPGIHWSMYLQSRSLTEKIGPYDERFFPGFFEDSDYQERLKSLSINTVSVPVCYLDHVGNGTIKDFFNYAMHVNKSRFNNKWSSSNAINDIFMRWNHTEPPVKPSSGFVPLSFNIPIQTSLESFRSRVSRQLSCESDRVSLVKQLIKAEDYVDAIKETLKLKNYRDISNIFSFWFSISAELMESINNKLLHQYVWRKLAEHYYLKSDWIRCYEFGVQAIDAGSDDIEVPDLSSNVTSSWYAYDVTAIAAYHLKFYDKALEYGKIAAELSKNDPRIVSNLNYYINPHN